jgi:hypothetical protein
MGRVDPGGYTFNGSLHSPPASESLLACCRSAFRRDALRWDSASSADFQVRAWAQGPYFSRARSFGARHPCRVFTRLPASECLSLAWPRESHQREGHPKAEVSGLLPSDSASGLRGFADSTSVCWHRTGRDPSRPPCGPFLRPDATAYGTLVARILRAKTKAKGKAPSATAPCVALNGCSRRRSTSPIHGVVPPASMQSSSAFGTFSRTAGEGSSNAKAGAELQVCVFLIRFGCARCAVDGPPIQRQCDAGIARRVGARDRAQFGASPGMDCRRTPGVALRSRRAGCPETAVSGWPSLWLLSLGHARESDSLAGRRVINRHGCRAPKERAPRKQGYCAPASAQPSQSIACRRTGTTTSREIVQNSSHIQRQTRQ